MSKYKDYIIKIVILTSFSFVYSQNLNDLQKMMDEYEKLKKNGLPLDRGSAEQIDPATGLPGKALIQPYEMQFGYKDSQEVVPRHFGYGFFSRRDSLAFWENLPTPANYLLGPGDQLVISLWGETQLRNQYTISRDGKIYDPKVGLLNLSGKTIEQGRYYLLKQYGRVYSTLGEANPSTFMDISLGELRSININFVGEVKFPGVYPVHPFSTVITGLIQAGGVDTTGSLRNVQLKRDGKIIKNVDLYDYLLNGNMPESIQLRDQDIVIVPVRESTITIDSSVVRPGIYESIKNENLKQMIDYAGGLKYNASSKIELIRNSLLSREKAFDNIDINNIYIDYNESNKIKVLNGDKIIARSAFESLAQVEIIGQIEKPGLYSYFKEMTLLDLFSMAVNIRDTTFLKSIYLDRGELIRRNPENRYETIIEIDINRLLNNDQSQNIVLQNMDRFVVHANLNFFEKKNVQILGEVNIPGDYPLLNDKESLGSFIERAGGFTDKALFDGIEIYRDSLRLAWSKMNISLMAGDSIVVKEKTGTIFVKGEVYNPGLVEFDNNKSINYYLNLAGGPTKNGDKNDVIVIYANGEVVPKRLFSSPKIKDGSTIIVNKKEIKEPIDITQFASSVLSIVSTTVTILVLSKQLNSGT